MALLPEGWLAEAQALWDARQDDHDAMEAQLMASLPAEPR